jgi:MFS family permease
MGRPGMGPPGSRPSLRHAIEVFENRDYRYLWFSSLFSFMGMQMQQVARSILAWDLTHSFGATGMVMLSFGLPMLLLSLHGGAIADRLNKKDLSVYTQIGTGTLALVTAILIVTDLMTFEVLFGLGLIQGTFFALGMPARQPLMALVVGPNQLMSAMAMGNAAMNGTRLIAPAAAGPLILWGGVEAAYFAMAALYLISVITLLAIPRIHGRPMGGARGSISHEIGQGLSYVIHDRALRYLLLMGFTSALFAMPYIALLPGFVERDLGLDRANVSYLFAATGVGALVGSLLIALFTEHPRKPLFQLGAGQFSALGLVLLGVVSVSAGFPGAVAAIMFLGLMLTSFQTLNMTMVIASAREEYYGRVMSIMMITFSTMPMMSAPLGFIADRTGAPTLFIAQGIAVAIAITLLSLANRSYVVSREAPRVEEEPAPVSAGG